MTSAPVLGVDTNVLVRFFTRDEPRQFALAKKLIEDAGEGELFIEAIVLVELGWVLRRRYGTPRDHVLNVLDGLMDFHEFTIGDRDLVAKALLNSRSTGSDFSDALMALIHEAAGCRATATFDRKAQRIEQMIPVEELVR